MITFIEEHRLPAAAYPFRGFVHLLRNPRRHAGPIFRSIIKVAVGGLIATIPVFRYGYGFQRGILTKIYGGGHSTPQNPSFLVSVTSAITATILCIIESSAITLGLNEFIVGSISTRLFESVLKEKNIMPTPSSPPSEVANISMRIGGSPTDIGLKKHSFLSAHNLMILSTDPIESWALIFLKTGIFIITLPLNIIPIAGPIAFISIQALFTGGAAHQRYYHHYRWTAAQRQRRIENHFWQYQRYGIVASLLEMVPFAGYLFTYTNHLGAALWAVDMHNRKLMDNTKTA